MNESRTPDSADASDRAMPWRGDVTTVLAADGFVVGVEIGSAGERVALGDSGGRVVDQLSNEDGRPDGAAEAVVGRLPGLVESLLERTGVPMSRVARIGVGFGGPVDTRRGVVMRSHRSPGWTNFPLCERLEGVLEMPVLIDNDARLAALGEAWFGAGQGIEDVLYVHWAGGVGGGLVLDGTLYHGASTTAGEIGHIVVDTSPQAPVCGCGARGHLEAFISSGVLLQAQGGDAQDAARPATLRALFDGGEEATRRVVDQAIGLLGLALANQVSVLNPGMVIIGGAAGLAAAGQLDRLREQVQTYAIPVAAEQVQIRSASLGEGAVVRGALALALDSLRR